MNRAWFREALGRLADRAMVQLAAADVDQLEAYFALLFQWSATINLTGLPLNPPTDQTIGRLLIEPLVAAKEIENVKRSWLDIGTGGGSPAIPIRIVRPALELTMVESRGRKAAFLAEVVRQLGLTSASVENSRFQDLVAEGSLTAFADLITVRAVRLDPSLLVGVQGLLRPRGRLFLFRTDTGAFGVPSGFELEQAHHLDEAGSSQLLVLTKPPST